MSAAQVVLVHDHFDPAHLATVTEQMRTMGSPTLRAIICADQVHLLEGCHRARAAAALGLPVLLDVLDYNWERDDERTVAEFLGNDDCDTLIGHLVSRVSSGQFLSVETE